MSDEFRKDFCDRFLSFELTTSSVNNNRPPADNIQQGTQETLLKTKTTPNTYVQDEL